MKDYFEPVFRGGHKIVSAPDVLKQPLLRPADFQVREMALNTRESFIVQAPAGSGKTTLLTKRLLRLLAEVEQRPEECLAITFTRKAAAEMRDRILEALQFAAYHPAPEAESSAYETWLLAKNLLKRDELSGWNLLKNPSRLRIQTVDSLCASITRQMPLLSHFGAAPSILDDPLELYREAALNLLLNLKVESSKQKGDEQHRNTEGHSIESSISFALAVLLNHLDNNLAAAERLLSEMLSCREQWLPYIGMTASIDAARKQLEKGLQIAVKDILHRLEQSVPSDSIGNEIFSLAKYAAEELQALEPHSPILACQKLGSGKGSVWPTAILADLPLWQGLAELLLTDDNQYRKTVTKNQGFKAPTQAKNKEDKALCQSMKQRMLAVLDALTAYPEFRKALEDLRSAPALYYSEMEWAVLDALVILLPALVAELILVFQAKGQVDFAQVLLAANRALGDQEDPSDLVLSMDSQIRHILVDEFQDISIPQFQLLEQLTITWENGEGRTLFLVGDPQQSIYRFRQAEVGLFLRVKEKGIGAIRLKPLTLTSNFRSSPQIVNWVNQYFSATFPIKNEIGTGAVAYTESVAMRHEVADRGVVAVEVKEVLPESEADQLLEAIEQAREQDPEGSMALLVRSRNHLNALIPALKQGGIVYQGVEIEPLKDKAILQDLLSLTKALLHLGERIAWLSLLRAPYCDLPLSDIFLLANQDAERPLWWALRSYRQILGLSGDGVAKLDRIVPCLEQALAERDRYPLSVWVKNLWLALLGSHGKRSLEEAQIEETFFAVLEEEGYCSDFYDISLLEKRLNRLYAKSIHFDPKALQIMTIHKAKGLEFDTVIVAGIGRTTRVDMEKLLLWESRVSGIEDPYLILAPIKPATKQESTIYSYLKRENQKRAAFEAERLMYVAATRAKKRLHWLQHNTMMNNLE